MQRKALARGKLDERKTAEFTEIISKHSSRMHRLVNRYLEYAQPFTPKLEQIDINQFLNNASTVSARNSTVARSS